MFMPEAPLTLLSTVPNSADLQRLQQEGPPGVQEEQAGARVHQVS